MLYLAVWVLTFTVLMVVMAIATGDKKFNPVEVKNIRVTLFTIPSLVVLVLWAVRVIFTKF